MKVHLYKGDNLLGLTQAQCGYIVGKWEVEKYETIDTTKVTCKNCRKTQAFCDLEKQNNETKKAIEEMNEIKDETIKDFKESEPKTYKQKIEIEIDVPVDRDIESVWRDKGSNNTIKFSFKKKVKSGAELIGCLCGVGFSLSEAKKCAENETFLIKVTGYDEDLCLYKSNPSGAYKYAYPVQADKLNELKAKLER